MKFDFPISQILGSISSTGTLLIAWNTYQLSQQIERSKAPRLDCSAQAYGGNVSLDGLPSTKIEIFIVSLGGSACWIQKILWNVQGWAVNIDSRELDMYQFPLRLEVGQSIKLRLLVTIPFDNPKYGGSIIRDKAKNKSIKELIEEGIIADFTKWQIIVEPTALEPIFVDVFNSDFRSAKAQPYFSNHQIEGKEKAWIGLKYLPNYLYRKLTFSVWRDIVIAIKSIWYGR